MVSGASGAARSQKDRRRNNGNGRSALGSAHGRNGKRRVETCNAGRAGAHRPSEALHPTRSSDLLPRIGRERVPTVPHVAKTRRNVPRRIARERVRTSHQPLATSHYSLRPIPRSRDCPLPSPVQFGTTRFGHIWLKSVELPRQCCNLIQV